MTSTMRWLGLALLGILVAAGVLIAASRLASQQIGLASQPISAGDALVPRASLRPARHRKHPPATAPSRTPAAPPAITPTQAPPPPATTPPTQSGQSRSGGGEGDHGGGGGGHADD